MWSDQWRYGLINQLKDKSNILFRSETLAVIRDSYPKSSFHFLVLPFDDSLDTVYDLTNDHLDLVDEFELLGVNAVEITGNKKENFIFGFHAKPSMKRLHMHVVSKDFNSPSLKNKKHWNSFNTEFFMPIAKVRSELSNNGIVNQPTEEDLKKLLNTQLKCNTCSYDAKHIPDLKKHLLTHLYMYIDKENPFIS